jgi:hypothetical protein
MIRLFKDKAKMQFRNKLLMQIGTRLVERPTLTKSTADVAATLKLVLARAFLG